MKTYQAVMVAYEKATEVARRQLCSSLSRLTAEHCIETAQSDEDTRAVATELKRQYPNALITTKMIYPPKD